MTETKAPPNQNTAYGDDIPHFDEKFIIKDKNGNPLFYLDEEKRIIFFYHEFCNGLLVANKEYGEGYRICKRCKKVFTPYLIHKKDGKGEPCGGKFRFLDKIGNVKRIYERECVKCGRKEIYSKLLLAVIFKEGISEKSAKNLLESYGFVPIETRKDVGNNGIFAIISRPGAQGTEFDADTSINKLEESDAVLAVSRVLVS